MDNRHWNTVTVDGSLPDQLVRGVIEDSYDLIVSACPSECVRSSVGRRMRTPAGNEIAIMLRIVRRSRDDFSPDRHS